MYVHEMLSTNEQDEVFVQDEILDQGLSGYLRQAWCIDKPLSNREVTRH